MIGIVGWFKKRSMKAKLAIACVVVLIVIWGYFSFRFDYQAGAHRIYPTAVDSNFWGHYMVYYKTTQFTKDEDEGIYWILRGRQDLVKEVKDAILKGEAIVVHYGRWIGFKGLTVPRESPIIKVDTISNSN